MFLFWNLKPFWPQNPHFHFEVLLMYRSPNQWFFPLFLILLVFVGLSASLPPECNKMYVLMCGCAAYIFIPKHFFISGILLGHHLWLHFGRCAVEWKHWSWYPRSIHRNAESTTVWCYQLKPITEEALMRRSFSAPFKVTSWSCLYSQVRAVNHVSRKSVGSYNILHLKGVWWERRREKKDLVPQDPELWKMGL